MRFLARNDAFVCDKCGASVAPIVYGGSYRNHCPYCLWSKHVDGSVPGDRMGNCKGLMEPIGVKTKSGGEYTLVHRCVACGFLRLNRLAGDDNLELVAKISGFFVK